MTVGDFEIFARHGPERLQRVHAAAVSREAQDAAIGASDGSADGERHAMPIEPPVLARKSCGAAPRAAGRMARPGSHGLIDNDGVLRSVAAIAAARPFKVIGPVGTGGRWDCSTRAWEPVTLSEEARASNAPAQSSSGFARTARSHSGEVNALSLLREAK